MTRVNVLVEGQTEESFIKNILGPTLWVHGVFLTPILIGAPDQAGRRTSCARVKKDILLALKQDRTACCTTMLDFYGLGRGFPGTPLTENLPNLEKAARIEQAVKEDVQTDAPDLRPDIRFLPYLQMHEYEGLLFSDPAAFAAGIGQQSLQPRFEAIRNQFSSPEDINDDPNTAPSKRVETVYSQYRKVLDGTRAARAVGIEKMRQECRHFNDWVTSLQELGR